MRLLCATLLTAALAVGLWYATNSVQTTDVGVVGGELESVAQAMAAWARFASTGDIKEVGEWFASDGPQYAQLQTEVATITPGETHAFQLSGARTIAPGMVRGSVRVTGPNGESRSYLWDIELVERDGGWKVWTVRTQPGT